MLVLNASYEPLHVTSAKRAITLIQYGVAEVLENSDDVVQIAQHGAGGAQRDSPEALHPPPAHSSDSL